MLNDTLLIRPATAEDFPAIARLLVDLYAVELPGALIGSASAQQKLFEFTLSAKQNQGLLGRYIACPSNGQIIATATLEYPNKIPFERAPAGIIRQALLELGVSATYQLLITVAKSLVPVPRPNTPNAVWLHSLVVHQQYRRQGVGQALIATLEHEARQRNYQKIWLQVLADNHSACRMYQKFGYIQEWSSPLWQTWLTWPSYLMSKSLT